MANQKETSAVTAAVVQFSSFHEQTTTRRSIKTISAIILINPSHIFNIWEGWGTSLAWWAKVFGSNEELADIFFTYNYTTMNGLLIPGLGLNIVRYNLGACSWNAFNNESMIVSPNMIPSRQMEGFWINGESDDINSNDYWDWTVDRNQRIMLQYAKHRNVNLFELFSNSPMWWMVKNHNPSGAEDGADDNLEASYDHSFVTYLIRTIQYAQDNWDVLFNYIEPFNEPMSTWWVSDNNQEGCHFDTLTQETIIQEVSNEMIKARLYDHGVGITASDENSYTLALDTWNSLNITIQKLIKKINVHGYEYKNGRRDLLYNAANESGKVLWNSEYGEGDASGMSLISNLNLDFKWLHMTAWIYWQVLDGGGWGLFDADLEAVKINKINTKYYVLAHYTRHIHPDMMIIEAQDDNTIASYDNQNGILVIIAMNCASEVHEICFDLTKFEVDVTNESVVTTWITNVKDKNGDRYALYENHAVLYNGNELCSEFDGETIQTIEIHAAIATQ